MKLKISLGKGGKGARKEESKVNKKTIFSSQQHQRQNQHPHQQQKQKQKQQRMLRKNCRSRAPEEKTDSSILASAVAELLQPPCCIEEIAILPCSLFAGCCDALLPSSSPAPADAVAATARTAATAPAAPSPEKAAAPTAGEERERGSHAALFFTGIVHGEEASTALELATEGSSTAETTLRLPTVTSVAASVSAATAAATTLQSIVFQAEARPAPMFPHKAVPPSLANESRPTISSFSCARQDIRHQQRQQKKPQEKYERRQNLQTQLGVAGEKAKRAKEKSPLYYQQKEHAEVATLLSEQQQNLQLIKDVEKQEHQEHNILHGATDVLHVKQQQKTPAATFFPGAICQKKKLASCRCVCLVPVVDEGGRRNLSVASPCPVVGTTPTGGAPAPNTTAAAAPTNPAAAATFAAAAAGSTTTTTPSAPTTNTTPAAAAASTPVAASNHVLAPGATAAAVAPGAAAASSLGAVPDEPAVAAPPGPAVGSSVPAHEFCTAPTTHTAGTSESSTRHEKGQQQQRWNLLLCCCCIPSVYAVAATTLSAAAATATATCVQQPCDMCRDFLPEYFPPHHDGAATEEEAEEEEEEKGGPREREEGKTSEEEKEEVEEAATAGEGGAAEEKEEGQETSKAYLRQRVVLPGAAASGATAHRDAAGTIAPETVEGGVPATSRQVAPRERKRATTNEEEEEDEEEEEKAVRKAAATMTGWVRLGLLLNGGYPPALMLARMRLNAFVAAIAVACASLSSSLDIGWQSGQQQQHLKEKKIRLSKRNSDETLRPQEKQQHTETGKNMCNSTFGIKKQKTTFSSNVRTSRTKETMNTVTFGVATDRVNSSKFRRWQSSNEDEGSSRRDCSSSNRMQSSNHNANNGSVTSSREKRTSKSSFKRYRNSLCYWMSASFASIRHACLRNTPEQQQQQHQQQGQQQQTDAGGPYTLASRGSRLLSIVHSFFLEELHVSALLLNEDLKSGVLWAYRRRVCATALQALSLVLGVTFSSRYSRSSSSTSSSNHSSNSKNNEERNKRDRSPTVRRCVCCCINTSGNHSGSTCSHTNNFKGSVITSSVPYKSQLFSNNISSSIPYNSRVNSSSFSSSDSPGGSRCLAQQSIPRDTCQSKGNSNMSQMELSDSSNSSSSSRKSVCMSTHTSVKPADVTALNVSLVATAAIESDLVAPVAATAATAKARATSASQDLVVCQPEETTATTLQAATATTAQSGEEEAAKNMTIPEDRSVVASAAVGREETTDVWSAYDSTVAAGAATEKETRCSDPVACAVGHFHEEPAATRESAVTTSMNRAFATGAGITAGHGLRCSPNKQHASSGEDVLDSFYKLVDAELLLIEQHASKRLHAYHPWEHLARLLPLWREFEYAAVTALRKTEICGNEVYAPSHSAQGSSRHRTYCENALTTSYTVMYTPSSWAATGCVDATSSSATQNSEESAGIVQNSQRCVVTGRIATYNSSSPQNSEPVDGTTVVLGSARRGADTVCPFPRGATPKITSSRTCFLDQNCATGDDLQLPETRAATTVETTSSGGVCKAGTADNVSDEKRLSVCNDSCSQIAECTPQNKDEEESASHIDFLNPEMRVCVPQDITVVAAGEPDGVTPNLEGRRIANTSSAVPQATRVTYAGGRAVKRALANVNAGKQQDYAVFDHRNAACAPKFVGKNEWPDRLSQEASGALAAYPHVRTERGVRIDGSNRIAPQCSGVVDDEHRVENRDDLGKSNEELKGNPKDRERTNLSFREPDTGMASVSGEERLVFEGHKVVGANGEHSSHGHVSVNGEEEKMKGKRRTVNKRVDAFVRRQIGILPQCRAPHHLFANRFLEELHSCMPQVVHCLSQVLSADVRAAVADINDLGTARLHTCNVDLGLSTRSILCAPSGSTVIDTSVAPVGTADCAKTGTGESSESPNSLGASQLQRIRHNNNQLVLAFSEATRMSVPVVALSANNPPEEAYDLASVSHHQSTSKCNGKFIGYEDSVAKPFDALMYDQSRPPVSPTLAPAAAALLCKTHEGEIGTDVGRAAFYNRKGHPPTGSTTGSTVGSPEIKCFGPRNVFLLMARIQQKVLIQALETNYEVLRLFPQFEAPWSGRSDLYTVYLQTWGTCLMSSYRRVFLRRNRAGFSFEKTRKVSNRPDSHTSQQQQENVAQTMCLSELCAIQTLESVPQGAVSCRAYQAFSPNIEFADRFAAREKRLEQLVLFGDAIEEHLKEVVGREMNICRFLLSVEDRDQRDDRTQIVESRTVEKAGTATKEYATIHICESVRKESATECGPISRWVSRHKSRLCRELACTVDGIRRIAQEV